jgi:hypothetical protein
VSGRAARRPPRLSPAAPPTPRATEPTPRQALVRGHATGGQPGRRRDQVVGHLRRLVTGDRRSLVGFPRFAGITVEEVLDALDAVWGWTPADEHVAIDPNRTLAGVHAAFTRIGAVADTGGRIAFATASPASLLELHRVIAGLAAEAGALVVTADETPVLRVDGHPGRRIWWVGGVAALTDGSSLLATGAPECGDEVLFELPARPDLLVGDGVYAAAALRAGIPAVALAGLESMVFGVAARRGAPVTVVPLDETRPPAAYAALEDLAATALRRGRGRRNNHTDVPG